MNRRAIAFTALFLALSLVFAAVTAEFTYRLYLLSTEKPGEATPSFAVYSSSIWQYDADVGYVYRPNGRMEWAMIERGYPVRCGVFETNPEGNPGEQTTARAGSLKVVVLGDSFTAMVHDGKTWPDLLRRLLETRMPGIPVSVLNVSRDGYGVLQMMDQAAKLVRSEVTRPDVLVMAMIGPDLRRHRFWRVEKTTTGHPEVYVSFERDLQEVPDSYARAALVNTAVTRAWCEELARSKKPGDVLLAEVHAQYQRAKRQDEMFAGARVRLWSLRDCYGCNTLAGGNPFPPPRGRVQSDGVSITRFSDDQGFNASLRVVREAGVPIWLVYVPWEPELRVGARTLDQKELPLFDDLQKHVDDFIDLTPARPLGEAATALTLLPVDAHPSMAGLTYYAETLAPLLVPRLQKLASGRRRE